MEDAGEEEMRGEVREGQLVLPGSWLGTPEEYVAGDGAYEEGDGIYASVVGHVHLDPRERIISVEPSNPLGTLRVGDHVLAEIVGIYEAMALAEVFLIEGVDRDVAGERSASIHISKMSKDYVSNVKDMFRMGDVIRAEVVQVSPSLQLVTQYPRLGVVYALCGKCRTPMERRGRVLVCPNCERKETRKLAEDYGRVKLGPRRRRSRCCP